MVSGQMLSLVSCQSQPLMSHKSSHRGSSTPQGGPSRPAHGGNVDPFALSFDGSDGVPVSSPSATLKVIDLFQRHKLGTTRAIGYQGPPVTPLSHPLITQLPTDPRADPHMEAALTPSPYHLTDRMGCQ
jgi:hypothetical protein